jgi:hypothetical protein
VGALYHQLPLIMLGYGLFGGVGWGLGYISPVSTLMRWFPDRRGMATGLALSAFGGGAVLAAPMIQSACNYFAKAPDFLGSHTDVNLIIENGVQYAQTAEGLMEVVVATSADLVNFPGLSEGVYLVGTGSTGAGEAFITLGVCYGALMSLGALGARVPAPGWTPPGYVPLTDEEAETKMISTHNVDHHQALYTPQFYLLWTAVMGNAVAGMAVISNAKMMMGDVFGVALPAIVTGAFCTSYVAALSASNAAGRLGWSLSSDFLGRKQTYMLFALGIPIVLCIPSLTEVVATGGSEQLVAGVSAPLLLFTGGTCLIVSFYGGGYATRERAERTCRERERE